jgi:hypothetical protein
MRQRLAPRASRRLTSRVRISGTARGADSQHWRTHYERTKQTAPSNAINIATNWRGDTELLHQWSGVPVRIRVALGERGRDAIELCRGLLDGDQGRKRPKPSSMRGTA